MAGRYSSCPLEPVNDLKVGSVWSERSDAQRGNSKIVDNWVLLLSKVDLFWPGKCLTLLSIPVEICLEKGCNYKTQLHKFTKALGHQGINKLAKIKRP